MPGFLFETRLLLGFQDVFKLLKAVLRLQPPWLQPQPPECQDYRRSLRWKSKGNASTQEESMTVEWCVYVFFFPKQNTEIFSKLFLYISNFCVFLTSPAAAWNSVPATPPVECQWKSPSRTTLAAGNVYQIYFFIIIAFLEYSQHRAKTQDITL